MTENTVDQPAAKRLERSRSDRMLAGVCGGLARYFGIHPAFYRVGFVVLTLIGGAGVLIYLAAALVIPDEGKEDSVASEVLREGRTRPWPLIGLGLLGLAAVVLLSRVTLWPHGDAAWILLLLAGGAILVLARHGSSARPPEEVPPEAPTPPAGGSEAVTVAVTTSAPTPRPRVLRAILLAFGALVALVLIAAAIFVAIFPVHLSRGVGHRTYTPASLSELDRSYKFGVGDLKLDLTNVRLPAGETKVTARVDVGDLRVIVPSDAAVRLTGDVRLGYLNLLGTTDDGRNVDGAITETGKRVLVLDTHVGVGSVRVTRAVR
jgi:phage shock protein PspC (stress-responsive transcriptional regulator)